MIVRWFIGKVPLLLGLTAIAALLALGIGRTAPQRPQLYMLSWQAGDPLAIMLLDVDHNLSQRFIPEPALPGIAVNDWALSPDGKQFVVKNGSDLMLMDNRGRHQRWLTQDGTRSYAPSWSPDGRRIAFTSERDNNPEIYVMGVDGDEAPQRLTNNRAADSAPSWSPDGGQIAFSSLRDGNVEIYVMDADGNNPRRLTDNKMADLAPDWSPDGQHILFTSDRRGEGRYQLFVMNADGSDQRLLAATPANALSPSWSPDGQFVMFWQAVSGANRINIMAANGGEASILAAWNPPLYTAVWSR